MKKENRTKMISTRLSPDEIERLTKVRAEKSVSNWIVSKIEQDESIKAKQG